MTVSYLHSSYNKSNFRLSLAEGIPKSYNPREGALQQQLAAKVPGEHDVRICDPAYWVVEFVFVGGAGTCDFIYESIVFPISVRRM